MCSFFSSVLPILVNLNNSFWPILSHLNTVPPPISYPSLENNCSEGLEGVSGYCQLSVILLIVGK